MPRSPLLQGLSITVRNPRPLVWTYVFNLATAWLAAAALRSQFSEVTRNSLEANRMIYGFDLGSFAEASQRVTMGPHGSSSAAMLGTPAYLLLYFLMVPGTLLAYQTGTSRSLGNLLFRGVHSFWSFVRIALLTLLVAVPVVGVAMWVQTLWADYLNRTILGEAGFLLKMGGVFVVVLVAAMVRLYFDLVEVHTVALSETLRPSGRPDRRVRKVLLPALGNLRVHFVANFVTFMLLAMLGWAALYFLGLSALHHLGQPRSWPVFLIGQLGLFLMLFARFWQRGAETVMVQNFYPIEEIPSAFVAPNAPSDPLALPRLERRMRPAVQPVVSDPIPEQEPIAPSLGEPDPGVYHHEVKAAEPVAPPPEKDLID